MPSRSHLTIAAASCLLALSSCVTTGVYEPIVDLEGVNADRYQRDLAKCRAYADKVDTASDTAENTVLGAAGGAALGAVLGAIAGKPGMGAALGATGGAFGAGGSTLSESLQRKHHIIDRCLEHRHYKVLG